MAGIESQSSSFQRAMLCRKQPEGHHEQREGLAEKLHVPKRVVTSANVNPRFVTRTAVNSNED